jgi:hypothetical protein
MKEHSEHLGADGKTVLKLVMKEVRWDVVGWMDLALDMDPRQAVMNIVMNLQVP